MPSAPRRGARNWLTNRPQLRWRTQQPFRVLFVLTNRSLAGAGPVAPTGSRLYRGLAIRKSFNLKSAQLPGRRTTFPPLLGARAGVRADGPLSTGLISLVPWQRHRKRMNPAGKIFAFGGICRPYGAGRVRGVVATKMAVLTEVARLTPYN